jgi:hypothetical protein
MRDSSALTAACRRLSSSNVQPMTAIHGSSIAFRGRCSSWSLTSLLSEAMTHSGLRGGDARSSPSPTRRTATDHLVGRRNHSSGGPACLRYDRLRGAGYRRLQGRLVGVAMSSSGSDADDVTAYAAGSIISLVATADRDGRADVIAVDMPMGLPDSGPRQADTLARKFLGRTVRRPCHRRPSGSQLPGTRQRPNVGGQEVLGGDARTQTSAEGRRNHPRRRLG